MRVTVSSRQSITSLNLDALPAVRLLLGASTDQNSFFLTLFLKTSPTGGLTSFVDYILCRINVPMADSYEEVVSVAAACTEAENAEGSLIRTAEAFRLFQNKPRSKPSIIDETTLEAQEIVTVYWQLREWMEKESPRPRYQRDVSSYKIIFED